MNSAYLLEGSRDEWLIVVRTYEKDDLLKVIEALKLHKETLHIAEQLEEDLYGEHVGRSGKDRSKNAQKTTNGARNQGRKAVNAKRRTKSST